MLKIEIGKCCMDCPHAYILSRPDIETSGNGLFIPKTRKVLIVGCAHRRVCKEYLNEPLQALPAELLFGEDRE